MTDITHHTDYRQALGVIKQRIQASQTRAVLAVVGEVVPQPVGQMPWGHVRNLMA
jgi:hypothetical protein